MTSCPEGEQGTYVQNQKSHIDANDMLNAVSTGRTYISA